MNGPHDSRELAGAGRVSPGELRRREMDMPDCFRTRDSLFVVPEDVETVNAVVKNEAFPR